MMRIIEIKNTKTEHIAKYLEKLLEYSHKLEKCLKYMNAEEKMQEECEQNYNRYK